MLSRYQPHVLLLPVCWSDTPLIPSRFNQVVLIIQTRMQAYKYPSTISCIKSTFFHEGIPGFYRGVLPQLISTTTLRAISWNVYTQGKLVVGEHLKLEGLYSALIPSILSGAGTGFFSSLMAAPLEFIKVQRQLQYVDPSSIKRGEKNVFGWLRHVVRHKGIFGLNLVSDDRFIYWIQISCTNGYFRYIRLLCYIRVLQILRT